MVFLLCLPVAVSGSEELVYTVQPGDTLDKLVEEYGVDSVQVEELRRFNRLKSAREIPPGTKIRFRLGWLKIKPLQARALDVSGPVTVRRVGASKPQAVTRGDRFKPGEVLQTGKNGSIMLAFGDGSHLLLQGNSTMTFEILEAYGDREIPNIRLHLRRGRVESVVAPNSSPDRRFEIRTPAGSAGARGTRFRVGADGEAPRLRTEVIHGTVAVAGGGKELPVEERFGTVMEGGQPPIPPLPLLSAPELDAMKARYRRLPLHFSWSEQPGAESYRVQIAPASAAGVLRVDTVTATPSLKVSGLEDGSYQLSVRGIDSHGLEGLDARHLFVLDAHPLPPVLAAPVSGDRVRQERPTFRWQPSPGAVAYRFQLAASSAFEEPLVDNGNLGSEYFSVPEALPPKRYYWRVASRDEAGKWGLFSEISVFDISLPPAPPADISIRKTAAELRLRWQEGKPGYRYHLQLANDAGFTRLYAEQETAHTHLTLPRPQQRVYMRMRTLDVDGFPGPFNQPIEIVPPLTTPVPLFLLGIAGLVLIL